MAIDSHETSSAVKEEEEGWGEVRERERERANRRAGTCGRKVGFLGGGGGGGGGGAGGHGGRQLDSGQKEKERREGECSE